MSIERNAVIDKLTEWQSGAIDAKGLWEWAVDVTEIASPADDAVRDVMDVLIDLPQDLVIAEDAQVMIEALNNPPGEVTESQNLVWNYFDFVDKEGRKVALADDPLYAPFCTPTY
jgi:hypothetical protein